MPYKHEGEQRDTHQCSQGAHIHTLEGATRPTSVTNASYAHTDIQTIKVSNTRSPSLRNECSYPRQYADMIHIKLVEFGAEGFEQLESAL
jgi:type VI protein secretion system component Hcp